MPNVHVGKNDIYGVIEGGEFENGTFENFRHHFIAQMDDFMKKLAKVPSKIDVSPPPNFILKICKKSCQLEIHQGTIISLLNWDPFPSTHPTPHGSLRFCFRFPICWLGLYFFLFPLFKLWFSLGSQKIRMHFLICLFKVHGQ